MPVQIYANLLAYGSKAELGNQLWNCHDPNSSLPRNSSSHPANAKWMQHTPDRLNVTLPWFKCPWSWDLPQQRIRPWVISVSQITTLPQLPLAGAAYLSQIGNCFRKHHISVITDFYLFYSVRLHTGLSKPNPKCSGVILSISLAFILNSYWKCCCLATALKVWPYLKYQFFTPCYVVANNKLNWYFVFKAS